MKEQWRDIKGYEGLYQVSNLGNVKRLARKRFNKWGRYSYFSEKIMISCPDGKGYLFVKLTKNKKRKMFKIHRLVAFHFLDNPNNFNQVNHINFDKSNNSILNIEWCNSYENQSHKFNNIKGRTSEFIGVHKKKFLKTKPFVAAIGVANKYIHLGCFSTEELASEAYLQALNKRAIKNKYANI